MQSTQPGWFTVTLSATDGRLLIDTQQPFERRCD
jgi:hypothetical protein